nr:GGDEF domain-containing protein [Rhodoferax sp.]
MPHPSTQSTALGEDRRSEKLAPTATPGKGVSWIGRVTPYWAHFRLDDIISTRQHSHDFVETRAEYIAIRLRFMALFFAIVVPLWMPIDLVTLRPEHFPAIALARSMLAAFLLLIAVLTLRKLSSRQTDALLSLTIIAPIAFYVASIFILSQPVAETPLVGYSFMPSVMAAMLGVFPLTLAYGLLLSAVIVLAQLGITAYLGPLISLDTLDKLWVLMMIVGVSLWIQTGQLLMLLKLYRESTQDPLTGLINRRVLMKRLATEVTHNNKKQRPFCILMFDLDRFKRINDNYGHLTGDKVLKETAQILKNGLRDHDIIARFGGEEFVAVLTNVTSEAAMEVAERIRQNCHDTRVSAPNDEVIQLSTSVGVTQYETGEAIEATLERVDECLYVAKEQGRNRVIHRQSDQGQELIRK